MRQPNKKLGCCEIFCVFVSKEGLMMVIFFAALLTGCLFALIAQRVVEERKRSILSLEDAEPFKDNDPRLTDVRITKE